MLKSDGSPRRGSKTESKKPSSGTKPELDFLPLHRPTIALDDTIPVVDCLKSGWLTTGARTAKFEKEFAEYVRAEYAVGVTSCTAALHLALVALDVGKGDEVITSPITFVSAVNVIHHVGAKIVFADVLRDDLNINPEEIKKKITRKTKAIILTHFAGNPCEMDTILAIAKKRNIKVIVDAAHAVETYYGDKRVGELGDATCYSFYANKNITTGEGGMLTTNNKKLAERVRLLRLHGMTQGAWNRHGKEGNPHWDMAEPGFKYNMNDIQAALGLSQLDSIEIWRAKREITTEVYRERLSTPYTRFLSTAPENRSACHLMVVIFDTRKIGRSRDEIMNRIKSQKVGVGVHFRAVHLLEFYRKHYGFKRRMFPMAEYASDRLLSLPLYPSLKEEDVDRAINAVHWAIRG